MEINAILDVSQEAFFDFLYSSIIQDVKESTGQTISKKDVKSGYSYDKKLKTKVGKMGGAKVTIVAFKPYKKYRAEFTSNQGKNIISYQVERLEDNKIEVVYGEDFIAADKMKAWNFKLINLFYKKQSIKRAEAILENIEGYIHSKGGEI